MALRKPVELASLNLRLSGLQLSLPTRGADHLSQGFPAEPCC